MIRAIDALHNYISRIKEDIRSKRPPHQRSNKLRRKATNFMVAKNASARRKARRKMATESRRRNRGR